jgi:hypothetical protein
MAESTFGAPRQSAGGITLLAGLTAVVVVLIAGSAAAKEMTCGGRHGNCVRQCVIDNSTPEGGFRCEQRVCDAQYDRCMRDSSGTGIIRGEGGRGPREGGGGGKTSGKPGKPGGTGGKGGKPGRDVNIISQGPKGWGGDIGDGILGNSPWLPSRGPAATGTPASAPAAPSAPPVILR